jgi:hypothetical protein
LSAWRHLPAIRPVPDVIASSRTQRAG